MKITLKVKTSSSTNIWYNIRKSLSCEILTFQTALGGGFKGFNLNSIKLIQTNSTTQLKKGHISTTIL